MGRSILGGMKAIRQNLGVCPQFDILWPDITVREHLELYCAIKGYSREAAKTSALSAAESVGKTTSCCVVRRNNPRNDKILTAALHYPWRMQFSM